MINIKDLKDKIKKLHYFHYICVGITIFFVVCSIFVFPSAFVRIKESFVDLWNSLKFYVRELLYLDYDVDISVNENSVVPFTPFFNLPATFEEFEIKWQEYWQIWKTEENLQAYFSYLGKLLFNVSKIVMLVVVPLLIVLYMLFQRYLSTQNNDFNKDSNVLKQFKKFSEKTYIPIKKWCLSFIDFVKQNNKYFKLWLFIWAYNFNVVTIIIEFLAFYFYFVMSFEFGSVYKQFYKLFCDLSVPLAFIPPFAWFIVLYLFICWLRKKIGYARLNHMENKDCGFINERPIVVMAVGTMGKKKTTKITDMALSQEKMFRDEAFKRMLKNDMKFPYFPWINLENTIKYAMSQHIVYNLATIRVFIKYLEDCFYFSIEHKKDKPMVKCLKRHLKKKYKINSQNFLFDYDYQKYGFTYDDKLAVVDIWQVIKTYAQLYFIYIIQSSLIIANYSIRTDAIMSSVGNFPVWDSDFFKRDSKIIDSISRHAHIIDFDALRLGKKMIEDNAKKDSFEFGVVLVTEIGKERKNNLELQEKKKNEFLANQKNDGFNDYLKMCRHSATVDNFPFIKFITDEQRPESWGADARDLCEIVYIRETSDIKLAMPFFSLAELLYSWIFDKFSSLYYQYRFTRSDNTLFMYLYKKVVSVLYNYYHRIYNTFGYCKLDVDVENGTQDGQRLERKYYLMSKKIYSKRFSTDCFSDFFTTKSLRSSLGLNDLEEYKTEKATFEELQQQNSYFVNDLMNKKNNVEKE